MRPPQAAPVDRAGAQPAWCEVVWHPQIRGRGLISRVEAAQGTVLMTFTARRSLSAPTALTLQTGERTHVLLDPPQIGHTNHSCDPSMLLEVESLRLHALRDIHPGDEISLFYPATEWVMARPFRCGCGSRRCIGRVTGARDLSEAVLRRHRLAPHIERLLALRAAQPAARTIRIAEQEHTLPPHNGQP